MIPFPVSPTRLFRRQPCHRRVPVHKPLFFVVCAPQLLQQNAFQGHRLLLLLLFLRVRRHSHQSGGSPNKPSPNHSPHAGSLLFLTLLFRVVSPAADSGGRDSTSSSEGANLPFVRMTVVHYSRPSNKYRLTVSLPTPLVEGRCQICFATYSVGQIIA